MFHRCCFSPSSGSLWLWRNSACPAGKGKEGGAAAAQYIAVSPGSPGPLFALSFIECPPQVIRAKKHGWIFESPQLSFEVRRRLYQKPRGACAGCKLPDSKKLWVERDNGGIPSIILFALTAARLSFVLRQCIFTVARFRFGFLLVRDQRT